ncbi:MAG: iron ABC transporter permease [Hyphomicrobium sp.]|nr:MAG: iron ABC transporter permease [Hyphomicrobium sp.]PPD00758.1 MAG: iron ABC transporter permease [Hyphomicrobium sp.]
MSADRTAPVSRTPSRPLIGSRHLAIAQETWWAVAAVVAALALAVPLISVVWIGMTKSDGTWSHLVATVLPTALSNSILLMAGAGVATLIMGTAAAWLITMHRFPGRTLADRLLVLPLAMPVYIVAYAYVELLDYAGPIQSALRHALGVSSAADYTFPQIRSLGGAIAIFALVLYPYVYLTARASFEQQSVCVLEVARTLGRTAGQTFYSVALPLARPALAAGVLLVLMESLNDLGAVQYLGVETLSSSIYATWMQRGSLSGAAQISLVMLSLIAVLLVSERALRGGGGFQATTGRYRAIPFETLDGWRAWLALSLVLLPTVLGFFVPFLVLASQAIAHVGTADLAAFARSATNSIVLAALASAVAILFALIFAYAVRLYRGRITHTTSQVASLGYALPGTVLAIGLVSPLAGFDNGIDAWMRANIGVSTGLMLSGSLFAVTFALVIRFLAVALGSVDAGLQRISTNLDAAARTLGSGGVMTLWRVHLPILAPALGAAGLLVFVDAMKELPATLLLRPFNFDTLATYVYGLTASEQFEEASLGAITIVLIGLIPVLWLHRAISEGRSRSGA